MKTKYTTPEIKIFKLTSVCLGTTSIDTNGAYSSASASSYAASRECDDSWDEDEE